MGRKHEHPICDFVQRYVNAQAVRLHMPGHKGRRFVGPEALDITEIPGADALYCADGIIEESQKNAASLFGKAGKRCIRARALPLPCAPCCIWPCSRGGRRQPAGCAGGQKRAQGFCERGGAAGLRYRVALLRNAGRPAFVRCLRGGFGRKNCGPCPKSRPRYISQARTISAIFWISRACRRSAAASACLCWSTTHTARICGFCPSPCIRSASARICCDSA